MLGPKRKRLLYVGFELGGSLPRDPVDEIQGNVVKSGIAKMVKGAPDVVRSGNAVEHPQELRLKGLCTEGDPVDAVPAQQGRECRGHRLWVRLDRDLGGRRQRCQEALELAWVGEGRRPAAEKDRLELRRQQLALELELGKQPVHVGGVLPAPADDGDEVAVAAPVGAEREMDVQMSDRVHHFLLPSLRFKTARKASCGTSTAPTCFIRRLPAFCFSSSFRLRVMSPP